MAGNVDLEEIILRTQNVLGKYVKKPTLSEKLLRKPPLRFLFDTFIAIIKETGFFIGLYSPEELIYDNIKNRDDKMKFLQKMIDVIKLITQKPLTVRASKIVSGHEPEKTNELLALIGEVIEKQSDWQTAVQQVTQDLEVEKEETILKPKYLNQFKKNKIKEVFKQDKKLPKAQTKGKDTNKKTKDIKAVTKSIEIPKKFKEKVALKLTDDKTEKESKEKLFLSAKGMKEKVQVNKSVDISPKTVQSSITTTSSSDGSSMKEGHSQVSKNEYNTIQKHEDQHSGERRKSSLLTSDILFATDFLQYESKNRILSEKTNYSKDSVQISLDNIEASSTPNETSENNTIVQLEVPVNNILKSENMVGKQNKEQPILKKENTFTRENSIETKTRPRTSLRPPSVRPASARPGAPRRRDKNVEIILAPNELVTMSGINVKLDTFSNFDDDGEHLVLIEDPTSSAVLSQNINPSSGIDEKQGHLVQQILKTQKELVQENHENNKLQERFSTSVRKSSARQIKLLCDIIQNLTKAINSLGKLMDFIPEDIDAMHLELSLWRNTFVSAEKELKREQSLTEETTEPLKHQLTQIDGNIKEYLEMIEISQANILRNSNKIFLMLSGNK